MKSFDFLFIVFIYFVSNDENKMFFSLFLNLFCFSSQYSIENDVFYFQILPKKKKKY